MKNFIPKIWQNSYKWQFEAYPFFTSVYQKSAVPTKNKYFTSFDKLLNNYDNGQVYLLNPRKEVYKRGMKIIDELLNGNSNFYIEFNKVLKEIDKAIGVCRKIRTERKSKDLEKWWPETQRALSDVTYILFNFDYPFDDYLEKLNINKPKDFELLNEYIFSNDLSFINEAKKRLIVLNKKYPKNFNKIYEIFMEEFGWFQNSYAGKFKITEKWLKKFLKEARNSSAKIKKPNGRLPKKYKLLAQTASLAIKFRDDKKKLLLIAVDLMEDWLRYICKNNKLKYEIMRWLTMDEILEIIKNKKISNIKRAKKYYSNKKRIGIMEEIGYKDMSENFWNKVLKSQNIDYNTKEIKGIIANKGKANGTVKIIIDVKRDGGKLKRGDILVTSMTRPEFLPLMSKASAFITDEGGISCHAAIVAREMGKPCIIGAKFATKVLHDGQMVEVDANRGIVKILNI